ncbi:uncharacterized protein TrAtP1_008094 [Trichoderma atroviride]|uniref:uncharacterized protein n=1 Tax=Hypocrea atroviridis TaxID=63577 RepID=UPI00331AE40A|nr:hypothetical protein TrAtP1_008094 [Trichoderma atroviride]
MPSTPYLYMRALYAERDIGKLATPLPQFVLLFMLLSLQSPRLSYRRPHLCDPEDSPSQSLPFSLPAPRLSLLSQHADSFSLGPSFSMARQKPPPDRRLEPLALSACRNRSTIVPR